VPRASGSHRADIELRDEKSFDPRPPRVAWYSVAIMTFGETIAKLRVLLDAGKSPRNMHTEARRLLREATEIAESYAAQRRALASIVDRQRTALRELEATLEKRMGATTS
jgi:hypothetical protein